MDEDEVSGRGTTVREGTRCEQCEENGQFSLPSAYCVDCQDYLCRECIELHGRLRSSKNHTLLEEGKLHQRKSKDAQREECTQHPGKSFWFYCPSHDDLACLQCFKEHHTYCAEIGLISDLSKDINTSTEFTDNLLESHQLKDVLDSYMKLIQEYKITNDKCYDKSKADFHLFRSDIEACLDALENRVLKEADAFKKGNKEALESMLEEVISVAGVLKAFTSDIELKQVLKQNDNVFIAVKRNSKRIREINLKINILKKRMQMTLYKFTVNTSIKRIIAASCVKEVAKGEVKLTGGINVKSPADESDCRVTAIARISSTDIVVVDNEARNACLKQISLVKNTVVERRTLGSNPLDMAIIPESRIAVTMPYLQQILLFSLDKTLTPCGRIDVDGACLALESTEDRLLISYRQPGKVQMVDLQGKVLMTITSDATGNPLFENPLHLSLSLDHGSIYVSDDDKHTVTCLGIEGSVNWIYQAEELKCPRGVASGPDSLYVCSRDTHSIHVVSPIGTHLAIIPTQKYDLRYPKAIHYYRDDETLYVSSAGGVAKYKNFVKCLSIQ